MTDMNDIPVVTPIEASNLAASKVKVAKVQDKKKMEKAFNNMIRLMDNYYAKRDEVLKLQERMLQTEKQKFSGRFSSLPGAKKIEEFLLRNKEAQKNLNDQRKVFRKIESSANDVTFNSSGMAELRKTVVDVAKGEKKDANLASTISDAANNTKPGVTNTDPSKTPDPGQDPAGSAIAGIVNPQTATPTPAAAPTPAEIQKPKEKKLNVGPFLNKFVRISPESIDGLLKNPEAIKELSGIKEKYRKIFDEKMKTESLEEDLSFKSFKDIMFPNKKLEDPEKAKKVFETIKADMQKEIEDLLSKYKIPFQKNISPAETPKVEPKPEVKPETPKVEPKPEVKPETPKVEPKPEQTTIQDDLNSSSLNIDEKTFTLTIPKKLGAASGIYVFDGSNFSRKGDGKKFPLENMRRYIKEVSIKRSVSNFKTLIDEFESMIRAKIAPPRPELAPQNESVSHNKTKRSRNLNIL